MCKHYTKTNSQNNRFRSHTKLYNVDSISDVPEWLRKERKFWEETNKHLVKVNEPWDIDDTANIYKLSIVACMKRILPQVKRYASSDSTEVFYNNFMQKRFPSLYAFYSGSYGDTAQTPLHVEIDNENSDALIVGKYIDGKQTFAIAYNIKKCIVQFYRLVDGKWKNIGIKKQENEMTYQRFFFEEVNGKPGLEIVMATHPNMNGNMWMELFCYSEKNDTITFAGNFCTGYEIDLKDTTLREEYGGSWYMDNHKTLYVWIDNYLVPLRKAVLIVPKSYDSSNYFIEYYENKSLKYSSHDKLNLIFREPYNEKSKKHQKYWDNFFQLKKYRE